MLGTTSILKSALKHGTGVRRIVLTSSVAAVREEDPTLREYDVTSWNKAAITEVASKGSAAGPVKIYSASKTLAERAAWKFVIENKAELAWDLVVINPPWIFGVRRLSFPSLTSHPRTNFCRLAPTHVQPSLSPAPTVDDINTSQREIYDTLLGARTGAQSRGQSSWVHVTVAADAHVRATHAAAAAGKRIVICSGHFFYQDIRESLLFPPPE